MNVVSVDSGKVHIAHPGHAHPFPKYSTPAMRLMKFAFTDAPADCHNCLMLDAAQEEDTMPAVKKPAAPAVDVDALTSQVHDNIDRMKAVDPMAEGALTQIGELRTEADAMIRKLPADKRTTLRKELTAAVTEATKAATPEPEPSAPIEATSVATRAEAQAEDPRTFAGVDKLITDGVKAFSEGLDLGLKLANVGDRLARIILEMRLAIPNPDAGNLPDITSIRKTTKNGAGAIYDEVRKNIADDDVDRIAAHTSMVRASQNKASDVLVERLAAFDTMPAEEARALTDAVFPGATAKMDKDAELRPSDAIRALYADHEIILPRYGRTELARIDRRVKKLGEAHKELEALEAAPNADEAKIHALQDTIVDLKNDIPESFLEPVKEKTDAEKTADALAAVKAAMEKAGKRAKHVKTAKQKNAVKAEAYALIRSFIDDLGLDVSALVPAENDDV